MKILAVDAATEACSAALLVDDALTERFEVIGRGHAGRLLPMADELLRQAAIAPRDLDAVAFGRGPGGFTGLRIAAGIAQGLAAGGGRPVVPVSNLAAVAAGAARAHGRAHILVCMDARMGQVYWAAFDCSEARPRALTQEQLSDPGAVEPPAGAPMFGAGHGFAAHPALAARLSGGLTGVDDTALPRAGDIARIGALDFSAGGGLAAALGLPVYLRDEVVHRR
ncbi:MAG TPA: tRNA (adenosine(37)-N6)-threonylcarbamoyltransferase complex dimerization subunit type 1 TsaB [Steroidobacteraceae bacterium]|nr:tRNA (adenosine(37)-N6)-threonylcarbamoyltransferase complex dimerization subunit type 1 TsaB [Steroidobacteraceae bacterium]